MNKYQKMSKYLEFNGIDTCNIFLKKLQYLPGIELHPCISYKRRKECTEQIL